MAPKAREGTQWSECQFVRRRFYNFLGGDAPVDVCAKEISGYGKYPLNRDICV